jgi:hypothetical protein
MNVHLEKFIEDQFVASQDPKFWWRKANNLRRVARTLYRATIPDIRRYNLARQTALKRLARRGRKTAVVRCREPEITPIFMLHGFALENAFKAVVIHQERSLISRKKLSDKLHEHDLIKLAQLAKVPLSSQEKQILHWISEVVRWKARYPTPTGAKYLATFFALDHTISDFVRVCNKAIDDVFFRLRKLIEPHLSASFPRYSVIVNV